MSEHHAGKILPHVTPLTQPFWEGCVAGELRMQHCAHCNDYQYYPRSICSRCGGKELDWHTVSGKGSIASFTIVRRAISGAYTAPYVVALVDLVEGPRMMSTIVGEVSDQIAVGAAVMVRFDAWGEGLKMPVFVLEHIEPDDGER
jgi:uncharacterized OB-fold protein